MGEFDKCRFCVSYGSLKCKDCCEEYSEFKADKGEIIRACKEKGISVCDLLKLIEL